MREIFKRLAFRLPLGINCFISVKRRIGIIFYLIVCGGVVYKLLILECDLRLHHKINKSLCTLFIFCAFRNAKRIIKRIYALFWKAKAKIGIVFVHQDEIACIIGCEGIFARLHKIENLVHNINGFYLILLLSQKLCRVSPVLLIGCIDVLTEHKLCNRKRIARIIKHKHLAAILLIP